MKDILPLFFTLLYAIISSSSVNADIIQCAANLGSPVTIASGSLIQITPAPTGMMCLIKRIIESTDSKLKYAPVARSYESLNWQRVAGPYRENLQIACEENDTYCTIQIPSAETPNTSFILESYKNDLTIEQEAARFFEQTTFGTTRKDLQDVKDHGVTNHQDFLSYASNWLYDQMYNIPTTLHRAMWRSRSVMRSDVPLFEGSLNHPCSANSHWRRAAFSRRDLDKFLTISKLGERYALSIDGHVRTVVDNIYFFMKKPKYDEYGDYNEEYELDGEPVAYDADEIGYDGEYDEGDMPFIYSGVKSYRICKAKKTETFNRFAIVYNNKCYEIRGGNPIVDLKGVTPKILFDLSKYDVDSEVLTGVRVWRDNGFDRFILDGGIPEMDKNLCSTLRRDGSSHDPIFLQLKGDKYFIFDSRLDWIENSLDKPQSDEGRSTIADSNDVAQCANVPKTFLNEHTCTLGNQHTCATESATSKMESIDLSLSNILYMQKQSGRYVHAIKNLRVQDSFFAIPPPCGKGEKSRWIRHASKTCPHTLFGAETLAAFARLISTSTDKNEVLKDIVFEGEGCSNKDAETLQFYVLVDGVCWKNVHPDEMNIYDFTYWTQSTNGMDNHPGGRNKIIQFRKTENGYLHFPSHTWHGTDRWERSKSNFNFLGRFGDTISTDTLPLVLGKALEKKGTLICGSPGEVANDKWAPLAWEVPMSNQDVPMLWYKYTLKYSKTDVWTLVSMNSKDQLRQRVAWALSQIFPIIVEDESYETEMYLTYYDVFTRNAFTNYGDVLREVIYSTLMGEMLTFYDGTSSEYSWQNYREVQFADENFARELLQLFTVGFHVLNKDGTHVIEDGHRVLTYTNADIMELARGFTGFTRQRARGNIETQKRDGEIINSVDPMLIKPELRDVYPKMGLDGKYIGDKYTLCSDFRKKSFLDKGSTYKLLGKTKISPSNPLPISSEDLIEVTKLGSNSELREELCQESNGLCTYPAVISLSTDLKCIGIECDLDRINVVEVESGIFYEYSHPPCVYLAFLNNGRAARHNGDQVCVDSSWVTGIGICCDDKDKVSQYDCDYTGQQTSYDEAEINCAQKGLQLCRQNIDKMDSNCIDKCCNYNGLFWQKDEKCETFVVVSKDGKVALERQQAPSADYHSLTFFRAHWDSSFPIATTGCQLETGSNCKVVGDYCRCSYATEVISVFNENPTSVGEVMTRLHITIPTKPFNYQMSRKIEYSDGEIIVHFKDNYVYDNNVVFEVTDEFGRKLYLKNVENKVVLRDSTGQLISSHNFRNPPTFFMIDKDVRGLSGRKILATEKAAYDETEAIIDHVLHHRNTAPYVVKRLIQRCGFSNPSPDFYLQVVKAFTSGSFQSGQNEITFGSGNYGDLAATFASIFLNAESRSTVLDQDSSFGSIRESLIKYISVMRSMEYKETYVDEISGLRNAESNLGGMSHHFQSIFSFFPTSYSSPGAVSHAGLVSPEGTLFSKAWSMLNSFYYLVEYGFNSCFQGLGSRFCWSEQKPGQFNYSNGHLEFGYSDAEDPEIIVDQLITLLTSGRMKKASRDLVSAEYNSARRTRSDHEALRRAQSLILSSPEFHTSGSFQNTRMQRPIKGAATKTCKPYKAIVHIMLGGGLDAYNLLVPNSGCSGKSTYAHYANARQSLKLNQNQLLSIPSIPKAQPCLNYGIHPALPFLQESYLANEALFVAGIGALSSDDITGKNFESRSKTTLFAHDAMEEESGKVDPYGQIKGTAIIGRLGDKLERGGYKVNSFVVDTPYKNVQGKSESVAKHSLDSDLGFPEPLPLYSLRKGDQINGKSHGTGNVFTDSWTDAWYEVRENDGTKRAEMNTTVSYTREELYGYGKKFESVAKMIGANKCRGSDRDLFYVPLREFDHHSYLLKNMNHHMVMLNQGLQKFVQELKKMGLYEQVTILISSEFGRTLTPNSSSGSDHGWSGHSIMLGGRVRGRQILGRYPDDITVNSKLNSPPGDFRIRLVPELPWESQWKPILEWMGVSDSDLSYVLPNMRRFSSDKMLSKSQVFWPDKPAPACSGEGEPVFCGDETNLRTESPTENKTPEPSLRPSASPISEPSLVISRAPSSSPSSPSEATTTPTSRPNDERIVQPSSNTGSSCATERNLKACRRVNRRLKKRCTLETTASSQCQKRFNKVCTGRFALNNCPRTCEMKCLPKSPSKIEEDSDLGQEASGTYESDIETIELEVTASGNQYLK